MSNLLVVDDELAIRESLAVILEDRGHEVNTAADAEEGWALLDQAAYDLILTDLLMPKVDGFEFIKQIREKYGRRIPIIIITAHSTVEIASMAINAGVDDFIIKPFDIRMVTEAVRYVLQKNRRLDQQKHLESTVASGNYSFEKKFFGLSSLDEISKRIKETSEIDEIGDTLFEQVRSTLKPERGLLVLAPQGPEQYRYQRLCSAEKLTSGQLFSVDHGILEWVQKSQKPLLIEDMASNSQYRACFNGMLNTGSLLAMPFLRKQRLLGAIVLYRPGGVNAFGEADLKFLSVLSCMATVALENLEIYDEMKNYFNGTIRALITTVETKDAFTFGHSARVARYSLVIAKALNMEELVQRRLEYVALLHDIGKIGIPEHILQKKLPLTDEEWAVVRHHPELGENIVRSIHFLPEGADGVRHHHEYYDGNGYPDGLKGEDIPLFARIIAVADSYDAMASDRPYRRGMDHQTALEELERYKGTQFDPNLVDLFIRAIQLKEMVA